MDIEATIGIDVHGRPGARVRRPHGSGDYVFVHFLAAARLGRDGSRLVRRGDCILWGPDAPTFIAADSGIRNDFLHMSADLAEPALQQFPIDQATVFRPRSTGFVRPLLVAMQDEWVRRDVHWERAVELHTFGLLLRLSRAAGTQAGHAVPRHADRLRAVRLQVHQDLAHPWTLGRMAELAFLKPSQFSALYRQLYQRSPIADLLHARLERARYYLAHVELPIATVGELVGYPDPAHFSRIFRKHAGCSPRQFRARYEGAAQGDRGRERARSARRV